MRTVDPTTPRAGSSGAVIAVLGGALCLSGSAVLVRLAGVDAATTAFLRCGLALLALVPLALLEARRQRLRPVGVAWAVVAGVALGVDYGAWTESIYAVGAGVSTVLINVQVVVLPLLAFVIDRERAPRRFVVAAPVMLAGLTLVGGVVGTGNAADPVRGTALGILAGTCYGLYLYLTRRGGAADPGTALQPLAWATAAATLTTAALAAREGGPHLRGLGLREWVLLAALALVGQVLAWLLIHHGSARLAPSTTAGLLMVQPVLALVAGTLVLGERPGPLQWFGAAVVLVAVAVANGAIRRQRR